MIRIARNRLAWLFGLIVLLAPGVSRADMLFELNIQNLAGLNPAGAPYSPDFTLIGSAGNTVTLFNFNYGGGGVVGPPVLTGDAVGDLSSTAQLDTNNPANFVNDINQPGNFPIHSFFDVFVDLTTNAPAIGGIPDQLSISILDNTGNPIPTTDPTGANTLVTADITSTGISVSTYGNAVVGTPTFVPVGVPEPASISLMVIGGAVGGFQWLRRRRSA